MAGGVSPFEWILPPVAMSHMIVNAAAQQVAPGLKLDTPDSQNAKQDQAAARQREQGQQQQNMIDQANQELGARQAANAPAEAERARLRAGAAAELLGGGGRRRKASQTLTDSTQALSGTAY